MRAQKWSRGKVHTPDMHAYAQLCIQTQVTYVHTHVLHMTHTYTVSNTYVHVLTMYTHIVTHTYICVLHMHTHRYIHMHTYSHTHILIVNIYIHIHAHIHRYMCTYA